MLLSRLALGVFLGLAVVSAGGHSPEDPGAYASDGITVGGEVERPLSLSLEELKALPVSELGPTEMRCSPERLKYTVSGYKGVKLKDLIEEAGVRFDHHHERNRMYVVAGATDDYFVVFSWHELFNTPAGDSTLVFYERDGEPVSPEEGPIALIAAGDSFTCGRHVKWLNRIEVRRFDP